MPIKKVGDFKVEYLQILNEKGIVDKKLMPKLKSSEIKNIYEEIIQNEKTQSGFYRC